MGIPRVTLTGLATFGALACGLVFSATPALAAPEKPLSEKATAITGTAAELHGEPNPKTEATVGYEFHFNSTGSCEGNTVGGVSPAKRPAGTKVNTPVTGLEGSTEYTFCIVAFNEAAESATSAPLKFQTLAEKPIVVSESGLGTTPFAATVEAQINPENQKTTSCEFLYGKTIGYGKSATCAQGVLEGPIAVLASANLIGLEAATTYHFRVVVKNGTGETKGVDGEFTTATAKPPTVASESITGLTSTDAKLEAKVNPNWQETSYHFEYATKATGEVLEGTVTSVEGAPPAPLLTAVSEEQLAGPVDLKGALTPGKIYFYRVAAKNEAAETKGVVQSFQALATPAVTTGEAKNLTRTSATLSGTVNPTGAATTYHFAYIEQAAYEAAVAEKVANPYAKGGRTTSESASVGSDYTVHAVGPLQVSELKPGTTYHYAVVAANSVGTTIDPTGATLTTSPPTPPVAVTGEAVGVTQLSATLTGAVNTQGLQTMLQFEFGTNPTPGHGSIVLASVIPGSESGSTVGIETAFGGYLQQGTTYYYRTVATNQDGTSYGVEKSFTTGSFPGLSAATPVQLVTWPMFVAAELAANAPRGSTNTGPSNKPLTNAQKLAKALTACKKRPKRKRAGCERQARKHYGVKHKATSKKK